MNVERWPFVKKFTPNFGSMRSGLGTEQPGATSDY